MAGEHYGCETILKIASRDSNEYIKDFLMQYMAKMSYLNLEISEHERKTIETNDSYKQYYQTYLQKLEKMKETKFYNNISLLAVVMASQRMTAGYARNEELVKAFDENIGGDKLLIYFSKFRAEVEKQRLRKLAAEMLRKIFKLNDSYHPVNQGILIYFCVTKTLNFWK